MIDVAFRDAPKVLNAWHVYLDALNGPIPNDGPQYQNTIDKKRKVLLHEMAKDLGYSKQLSQWDVDRVYSPRGVAEDSNRIRKVFDELLRLLKSTHAIATLPKTSPRPPDAEPPAAEQSDA